MTRTLRITYSLSFLGLLVGMGSGPPVACKASSVPSR